MLRVSVLRWLHEKSPMTRHVGSSSPHGISFAVDDVVPDVKPIWTETLAQSVNRRFRREVFILPRPDTPIINLAADSLPPAQRASRIDHVGSRCHPLIEAVHTAFSRHYPLTLSPDAIWLTIAQGFSHHITENAATLRDRLVRHRGRAKLVVKVVDLSPESFEYAIPAFSS